MSKNLTNDEVTNRVLELIMKRQKAGYEEYGTTLADNKGDILYWLRHLQEEMLDAAQYIEKLIFDLEQSKEQWQNKEHKDTPLKDGQ